MGHMGMRRVALVALFIVSQSGCFFMDDEDGDPANYIAIDQLDSSYKDAYCTYLARCGLFPDQATCVGAQLQNGVNPFSYYISDQLLASFRAGRVRYNGSNVKKCFDAIAAMSCDTTDITVRTRLPECNQFIAGAVKSGGECYDDLECASGYCANESEAPACTVGSCIGDAPPPELPAQLGEPCGDNCASGLYCDNTARCATLKPAGSVCVDNRECGYGLGCTGSTTRTCAALPAAGQPCPDGLCRDYGNRCITSTTVATCVKVGVTGAHCTTYSECSDYYPCDYNTMQCKALPAIGESCASSYQCFADDAYCDQTTTTCKVGKSDGSTCASPTECISGMCSAGVCGTTSTPTCP